MTRSLSTLLGIVMAFLGIAAMPAPVAAAEQDDDAITWMVRPSDGVGEDGRSWVELELDAGETVQEHLLVRNLSASPVTFSLTAADGYFTETGRFNMLTADRESVDAGTWIEIQDAVEVPAGADVIVPFTITVPGNATPGDHPAGVAAAIRSGGTEEVGIESRVGFRVMTRVTGELAPAAAATVAGEYTGSLNPFEAGRIDVDYSVENTGNTRLSIVPLVEVSTLFGWVSYTATGEEIVEIAPGESRVAEISFPSVWPLFVYSADVTAAAEPVSEELPARGIEPASAHALVVAIPWPQLVSIAVGVLLLWLLWRDRRRRDRKVAELVAQARRDALAESAGDRQPALRRVAGSAVVAIALLLAGPPAMAATPEDDPVGIRVEIAPRTTPGATPPATPAPATGGEDLATTGAPDMSAWLWGGAAAVVTGAVLTGRVIYSGRRRRAPETEWRSR